MAVEPLTANRTRLRMTVSPEFLEKLEAARLALSHAMPGAAAEDVLSAGLDLLLQRDAKRKGLAENPRPAPPEELAEPGAAYVPAAVKREVWTRDGGCCQWPISSDGVCGSRLRVQLDHRVPRAAVAGRSPPTSGSPALATTCWRRASGWGTGSWTATAATRGGWSSAATARARGPGRPPGALRTPAATP